MNQSKKSLFQGVVLTVFTLILFGFAQNSVAAQTSASPYVVLKDVGGKLFGRIAALSPSQRKDQSIVRSIVKTELMPFVDTKYASYRMLGKSLKKSSPQQRTQFVAVMHDDLTNTFAAALANYNKQTVTYEPSRETGSKQKVTVKAQLSSPDLDLHFKFRKDKNTNQWRVYDLVVEGISLLSTKRSEITGQLRQHGVAGLIEKLQRKVA
jgi:phospholipid transport system substrate-binding protein